MNYKLNIEHYFMCNYFETSRDKKLKNTQQICTAEGFNYTA